MPLPVPSFDRWTTLFCLFAFQSLLVGAVLFLHRRGDRPANRALGLLLFLFAITLFDYELYWTHYDLYFPAFAGISAAFPFLFGPILLYYMRRILRPAPWRAKDLLHVLTFALDIAFLLPFYLADREVKLATMLGQLRPEGWRSVVGAAVPWLMVLHMALYALLIRRLARGSGMLNEMRRWTLGLLLCFMGYILAWITYLVLVRQPFFDARWDYMISFAMAVFITFIAVFGYLQPGVFNGYAVTDLSAVVPEAVRYRNSGLTEGAAEELYQRLEDVMRSALLHQTNDLRLEGLAERLGTSKHHLSQVINERSGLNFFGYVNRHRVEEAKTLLSTTSKEQLHVIEIAYQVGFNTKAAFNSAFKRFTGTTPTAYRGSTKG
jgi:AraC-like DNA-binding protein/heme/copper-type cytochrome/quinol oxidase subunit 4